MQDDSGPSEERVAKRQRLDDAEQEEEEDEDVYGERQLVAVEHAAPSDLYLDTVDRSLLDFDFERLCSVTLSSINVYACLVCGKYFQGRGKSSPAYAHSLNEDHHVFIHLDALNVYILPDLYPVDDPSLQDIKGLLQPKHTPAQLEQLSKGKVAATDLTKQPYTPGFIGLNNVSQTSFMNAILQLLLHITPLRDYFIQQSQSGGFDNRSELVQRLGMLYRKFWNPRLFKAQVSPHEFLQEVTQASGRQFRTTQAGDPLEFLSWLLNALHRDLGGSPKKANSSIIYSAFRGMLRIQDQAVLVKSSTASGASQTRFDLDRDIKTTPTPFLFLSVDLPPPPVFQDAIEKNIIPQVPISAILAKYDGRTSQSIPAKGIRRYKITSLPPILIMHFKRFTSNNFVEEKNPTIVNYPLRGIDMRDYLDDKSPPHSTYYDLVANITHTSTAGTAREDTTWKVHVHTTAENEADEKWFQIQDLIVEEINKQVVFLGETYIQVWERRLEPGQKHDLVIDTSSVLAKPKTTKAKMAKLVPAPEELARKQKETAIGVKMGKMRVEKGDSGGIEL